MKNIKMASPLYIVRDECEKDLFEVLRKLSDIGFDGIEFLGFFGKSAKDVRLALDDLELEALGNHVPFAQLKQDPDGILSFHKEVGCRYLTVASIEMDSILEDVDALADEIKQMADKAKEYGITLLYHNHDEELVSKSGGREALDILLEGTAKSDLYFEPDLGWIEAGLGSSEYYLKKYADRCPVIHLKDYYTSNHALLGRVRDFVPERGTKERGEFEFRPTGYGVLNMPKLLPLCLACKPEWFVMDHDLAYERDPYEDLRLSLEYTKNLLNIHK